jgi:PAS domain S-box-containing protein
MCDLDFVPFYVNPAGRRLVGLDSLAQACSVSVQDYFFPEDQSYITNEFLPQVLRAGRAEVEIRFRHFQTGPTLWMIYNVFQVHDENGRVVGYATVSRNITERKLAEEALREREQRYELVLAGAGAAIWDWDVPAKRVVYSPLWKQMRGFDDEEVSDREEEWSRGIHPEDRERVLSAVKAHFDGRTPVFAEEYRVRHKSGRWIWILDRGLALSDPSGRVIRMAGSETDITERKRGEQALREARAASGNWPNPCRSLFGPVAPRGRVITSARSGSLTPASPKTSNSGSAGYSKFTLTTASRLLRPGNRRWRTIRLSRLSSASAVMTACTAGSRLGPWR